MHAARLKKLLKDIVHEDPARRRSAAEGLADGDERAIYPLIKSLRDENFGVQDAAMHSLMAMRGEVTAYMVLPLLRENSFLRNTALVILTEVGEEAVALLPGLLKDKDDDVRKFALDLIHDIRHCDYTENVVELLEHDPNANVRAAAAKTIGNLQFSDAVPHLIEALNDEEWVCFSALEALTNLQDETSIRAIRELLEHPSDTIRFAAIEALGKINYPESTEALTKHIEIAKEFERTTTITSLIKLGTVPSAPGVSESLIDMMKEEEEWDDKLLALRGLVELNETSAIKDILDTAGLLDTSNPEDEDRLYFIKNALGSFNCNKDLLEALVDPDLKYRGKVIAIETIGDLQCSDAVPYLIKLLKSESRDIRRSSVKVSWSDRY